MENMIGQLLEKLGMGGNFADGKPIHPGGGTIPRVANQDNYKKYAIETMSQGQEPLPYEQWQQKTIMETQQQVDALRGGGQGMEGGY